MSLGKDQGNGLFTRLQHIPIFSSGKLNLIIAWINIYGCGREEDGILNYMKLNDDIISFIANFKGLLLKGRFL